MTVATDLLDLDIWLAVRPDGMAFAYTHEEPRFRTATADLDDVVAECRGALRAYAQTSGGDLAFGVRPAYRPGELPVPRAALPLPGQGASVVGRLVVHAVRGEGADLDLSRLPLAALATAPGAPARPRARDPR